MVTLEQIKLLESKLTRAINFVTQLTEENSRLKKRSEALEETIIALKEEKARVEEGIVSALGKLNQFEDAIERSLGAAVSAGAAGPATTVKSSPKPVPPKQNAEPEIIAAAARSKPVVPSAYTVDENPHPSEAVSSADVSEEETESSALEDTLSSEEADEIEDSGEAELDIF